MKKNFKLLFIAFLFYLLGHILWTFLIISDNNIFNHLNQELIVSIPFLIFTIIGLIATYRLYKDL